jgi:hypothetical protein
MPVKEREESGVLRVRLDQSGTSWLSQAPAWLAAGAACIDLLVRLLCR